MPHHTSHRRDILIGGALLAAVAVSTGGVVAEAAPAATECTTARQDVKERQQELTEAVAAYRKQTGTAAALQAKYQRLQADDKATAADIEAARLAAYNAQTKATDLFAAQRSAGVALQEAVRVAEGTCAKSQPQPPHEPPPTTPGDDHPRPSLQHPRPGHPHGPIHRPSPVIHVESSSISHATAVAAGGPAVVAMPVVESHDEGWFGGWVGDWFGGSGDGGAGSGPGEGGGATVAAPEQTGSSLPLGAVDTGDGSAAGLDLGHIGMAVAGLGALGLAGAGGATVAGRRQRRS